MNKLAVLCGMVFLGITSTPQENNSEELLSSNELEAISLTAFNKDLNTEYWMSEVFFEASYLETENLDIAAIPYAELEEDIILGFDTTKYLPENFDPTVSYIDLSSVQYLKMADYEDIGFDTAAYLPASFDPYAFPKDFMDISFIEKEEVVDLGFDTRTYLPQGYDSYEEVLDLDSIIFIEEDDFKYGYNASKYFPLLLNP